ncbi:hypothetical protein ACH5RR_032067 [Cinchona calisaya]|uniref:Uncharacterized protein n=1 Tax=Cinchona calisaya TaxID=153742 RepID=A0ABD2YKG4_9GENT
MAIGQANWNHSNEQLEMFQRDMDAHICKLNELDEVVNQSKDLKPEQRSEIWGKLFLVGIEKVCDIILGISEEERSQIWANVVKEGIQTGGDVLMSLLEEWSKGVGHPPNIASSSTAFRHIPTMSISSMNRDKE